MTDVPQERKEPEGLIKSLMEKFVDRLPTMDEDKARLLFISVLTCATLGTLGGMQKHELGWIVFFTFLSGMFAGVGIPLLRAYLVGRKTEKSQLPVSEAESSRSDGPATSLKAT